MERLQTELDLVNMSFGRFEGRGLHPLQFMLALVQLVAQ